ncbi:hypothetical protein V9T40_004314 [Parthenolecanium corni]|uniref:Uncharacterized protein n=1 Tax=Parthenolecanium corni TaxID=536013 RepID=A0AAN9Y9G2_9HEMI
MQYVQGQSPSPKIREYFYYIDHQGMLFLDDARIKNFTSCFKDKQFLVFFFKKLGKNDTDRYPEFPYLSRCGRERNYVKCDDYPIVFTHVSSINEKDVFCHNHAADLLHVPFEPDKIFMHLENGRIYHPCPSTKGSVGLIASKLAIEFSKLFIFDENEIPTHFRWKDEEHKLCSQWFEDAQQHEKTS